MMRSMFSAITGLKANQTALDVTANDIANVNTVGYKSARTVFSDVMAQTTRGATAPGGTQGGVNAMQVGLGVRMTSVDNLMSQGAPQATGNPLDVSIQGEGWFRVGTSAPPAVPTDVQYTRAGNFGLNRDGYLVTADGSYVVGRTAAGGGGADTLIQVPPGATNVSIGQDGAVTYLPAGGGAIATAGYLSLAQFANQQGLERAGSSRWTASVSSAPSRSARPAARSASRCPARSRCRTWTSPRSSRT